MPVVQSLMDNLVRQYGEEKGQRVYYAMEAEGSGPFAPGKKHRQLHEDWAAKHGVAPVGGRKKKPGPPKKARARKRR